MTVTKFPDEEADGQMATSLSYVSRRVSGRVDESPVSCSVLLGGQVLRGLQGGGPPARPGVFGKGRGR